MIYLFFFFCIAFKVEFLYYFQNRIIVEQQNMYKRSLIVFCWCPDRIKIIARTTVSAYTPGQMINMDMIVDNQCGLPILKFTVLLIRVSDGNSMHTILNP